MRTVCSSPYGGRSLSGEVSLIETHPGQTPPTPDRDPPKEHVTETQTPPKENGTRAARQEVTSYRDPPVDRMTDMCKNITLPQTSFAGGKYVWAVRKTGRSSTQVKSIFDTLLFNRMSGCTTEWRTYWLIWVLTVKQSTCIALLPRKLLTTFLLQTIH